MSSRLIWQPGIVRVSESGKRWLEFSATDSCARCASGQGCGAGLFSGLMLASRPARLPLSGRLLNAGDQAGYQPDYQPGQALLAGIRPGRLVIVAALLYLFPVLAFVAGALLAESLYPDSDVLALTGGVLGCMVLWLPVLALARRWPVEVDRISTCRASPARGDEA